MPDYKYLIVGGGMTADAAVKGVRKIDDNGVIGIIGNEPYSPYDRPPLSKALWKGEELEHIQRNTPKQNVDMHLSKTVTVVDPDKHLVLDDNGKEYSYQKLLLATGGTVRRLQWNVDGIIYFRTLDDYNRLRKMTENGNSFVVIGGGFIGSEIAAALAMNNKSVTMIFPEDSIGMRVYPQPLSHFLNTYYQSKGIKILHNDGIKNIRKESSSFVITTTNNVEVTAHGVIAGIGISPNVSLAQSAGLSVNNGIVVDEFLRTSNPDIFAAGDVANFYNPALDKRIRVEHEDNANTMGDCAGRNMAGDSLPYHHLPFFYSDLFELGYEAVGEIDARLEIVEDWKDPFKEGIIYYLENGRVRGVLLWNTWGQVNNARALIAEKEPLNRETVKGRLPA